MIQSESNSVFSDKERAGLVAQLRGQAALEYLESTRPGWAMGVHHDFPHDHGQLQVLQSDHKIRVIIPGNGFGKTTAMGMDADMLLQLDDPFKPQVIPDPPRPTTAVWFCQKYQQWEIIRGDLEPTIFTKGWKWKEQKHVYEWPNGSKLYILSSDSDWTSIQGIQIDAVYFDEHPDKRFWVEMQYRRRGQKKTRYMVAATMTQGITWFVKDVIKPWQRWNREQGRSDAEGMEIQDHRDTFCWLVGGIEDNPGMDEEDKAHYESITSASAKERLVRLKGGYADFTGEPVFDLDALEWMTKEHAQEGRTGRLTFLGDEDDDMADRILHAAGGEELGHRWAGVIDQEFFTFHEGMPIDRGRLTVFEEPNADEAGNYVIGADFAAGLIGKDYDTACVGRKTADGEIVQVAEAEGHWGDIFFAEMLYSLGCWYHEALICGERQFGLPTLRRLYDEMGYTHLLHQRRAMTVNERITDLLGHHKSPGDTTIPNFRLAIKRRDFLPRSTALIQQLIRFQFKPRQKTAFIDDVTSSVDLIMGAPEGEYDDLVLAGNYCLHGAREMVHFPKPARRYRKGSFGDVMKLDKVLKGGDRKKRDPYEIKL